MATRVSYPTFKAFTVNGTLAIGYKLYTYEAGTTTLLETYQDAAATTPHTNPIILDSLGEAEIFINEAAKFTLTDADDAVISGWPVDNIDVGTDISALEVSFEPTGSVSSTNVQGALKEVIEDMEDFLTADDLATDNLITLPSGVEMEGGIVGLDCSAHTDTDHDVQVAAGACVDSGNTLSGANPSTKVKQIDATWVEGSGEGGLLDHATAAVAANTLYDFYALIRDSDGELDFGWVANARDIEDFLPTGYTKYRWLRFHMTNASSNIKQTTQSGDYILNNKSSDWVLSTGVTTSLGTVAHGSFVPVVRIAMIEYGIRDGATDGESIYASDDGTNTSFLVGSTQVGSSDTSEDAWGRVSAGKTPLRPFLADREFRSTAGTLDLLIHSVKLRR